MSAPYYAADANLGAIPWPDAPGWVWWLLGGIALLLFALFLADAGEP